MQASLPLSNFHISSVAYAAASPLPQAESPAAIQLALDHGTATRATSATALNSSSSRSHLLLLIKVAPPTGGMSSMLTLVDLAGSERTGKSEVGGVRQ